MFFDPDGCPLTAMQWAELHNQRADNPFGFHRVDATLFEGGGHPPVRVSTVWVGFDKSCGESPEPMIYETMVFGGSLNGMNEWYATWQQAERGHSEWIKRVGADLGISEE